MTLRVLSWNVLCPAYKRLGKGRKEKSRQTMFMNRLQSIVQTILSMNPDILCIQELWVQNSGFISFFLENLPQYNISHVQRNYKEDGVAILYRKDSLTLQDVRKINLEPSCCSRVMLVADFFDKESHTEFTVATTHMTFPHDNDFDIPVSRPEMGHDIINKLRHGQKNLIIAGDFNCSFPFTLTPVNAPLNDIVRELGVQSAFHTSPETGEQARRPFVSHFNHNGEAVGVDHILFRGNFQVEESFLWPRELPETAWPEEYTVSDHRPLCADFTVGEVVSPQESPPKAKREMGS